MKPRILDLFCGAGGAAMGYHRAGFEVVGVDIKPQPRYPFEFVQADAVDFVSFAASSPETGGLSAVGRTTRKAGTGAVFHPTSGPIPFAAIHASPPCQAYSAGARMRNGYAKDHPRLIEPTRELLEQTGLPYVIENVPGAPLRSPTILCGSQFGLDVRRHRAFESNVLILSNGCTHGYQDIVVGVYGDHPEDSVIRKGHPAIRARSVEHAKEAMGIDWMETWDELKEAIPPAYTELIGHQLMSHLKARAVA